MILLTAVGSFLFGAWFVHQWGNHRAKYYRKQMKKALVLASKVQDANKFVLAEMEEMKKNHRREYVGEMKMGVIDALADIARVGV